MGVDKRWRWAKEGKVAKNKKGTRRWGMTGRKGGGGESERRMGDDKEGRIEEDAQDVVK